MASDDVAERIHVVPLFGREHDSSAECWCQPEQDIETPLIFIHHPEQ